MRDLLELRLNQSDTAAWAWTLYLSAHCRMGGGRERAKALFPPILPKGIPGFYRESASWTPNGSAACMWSRSPYNCQLECVLPKGHIASFFLPFGRIYGHKTQRNKKSTWFIRLILFFGPLDFIRKHPSRTPFA